MEENKAKKDKAEKGIYICVLNMSQQTGFLKVWPLNVMLILDKTMNSLKESKP